VAGADAFADSLGTMPSDSDLNAVQAIRWAGILLALILFACAAVGLIRQRRRRSAFAQGRIEVLEGPMNKAHTRGHGMPDRHRFRVGHRSFETLPKLWELLTQGAAYRLYCVDDQLLSLEPVLDDPLERAEHEREAAHFERSLQIKPSSLVK
jgi:hypothetical protein